VLLDGSALEVFTSTGETLTTRVYRGHPPSSAAAAAGTAASANTCNAASEASSFQGEDETGISLFAAGAAAVVSRVDVWEMGCCMVQLDDATWLDQEIYVHPQHQADDADQDRVLRQVARSTDSSSSTAAMQSTPAMPAAAVAAELGVSAAAIVGAE
jgi:hypothetical protein